MIRNLLKSKMFMVGFLYLLLILGASLFYKFVFHDVLHHAPFHRGQPRPYLSPIDYPPFGTDRGGYSFLDRILIGARYTLAILTTITLIRLILSTILGVILGGFLPKLYKQLKPFVDSYKFFPGTMLFILIYGISRDNYIIPENIVLAMVLVALITVPTTSYTIAGVVRDALNKEFIESSSVLGAGRWRLLTRHVRLYLTPNLFLVFVRELIVTVNLVAHLCIFHLLLTAKINSFDWMNTLGSKWDAFWGSAPWMSYDIIFCVVTLVLAFEAMAKGIEHAIQKRPGEHRQKRRKRKKTSETAIPSNPHPQKKDFQWVVNE